MTMSNVGRALSQHAAHEPGAWGHRTRTRPSARLYAKTSRWLGGGQDCTQVVVVVPRVKNTSADLNLCLLCCEI